MKKILASVLVMTAASISMAGALDGRTFCRTVKTHGFGQPAGERQHCVGFAGDYMTDNANTFFGNPPETVLYYFDAGKVIVMNRNSIQSIVYSVNSTMTEISNEVGAVLKMQE